MGTPWQATLLKEGRMLLSCTPAAKSSCFLLSGADIKCMLIWCLIHSLIVPGLVLPFVSGEAHKTGPRSISGESCISF